MYILLEIGLSEVICRSDDSENDQPVEECEQLAPQHPAMHTAEDFVVLPREVE